MVAAPAWWLALALAAQVPAADADTRATRQRLLAAEDARAATPDDRVALRDGLTHTEVPVRLQAIRAMGRLEESASLPLLSPLLDDVSIEVRAEAAQAIAQSAVTPEAAHDARVRLAQRLRDEPDGGVRGALATSLGRLPFDTTDSLHTVTGLLQHLTRDLAGVAGPSVLELFGTARGAAALTRRCTHQQADCRPLVPLLDALWHLARDGSRPWAPAVAARVRRLTAPARLALGNLPPATRDAMLTDADAEVRRAAVLAAAADRATMEADARGWLDDPSMLVRHAVVVRAGARWPDLALRAMSDDHLHVRLAAIDVLGTARRCAPCGALVGEPPADAARWHVHAHALVALARTDGTAARPLVARAAGHAVWQVRMYAARAATETADIATLRTLGRDIHPNVREAALTGLTALEHRDSDDLRIEALESDDYQLLRTAALTLDGTPRLLEAREALLAALARLAHDDRDTGRDPREAIRERLAALDGTALPPPPTATGAGRREPLPTIADTERLDGQQVVLSMQGGGEVVIRLAALEAPTNVARFARQVAAGAWDGLTFHRVEPGFVVQGGSPGANEYVGADLYTRDERSTLSHARGTVGISTRGRDTGDGQIFINLVDNPRLDHAYTVIGTVVSGLPTVDAMLEGAVITRARVVAR